MIPVTSYRIGWWTHRWWPRLRTIRFMLTGRQADHRKAPRRAFLNVIVRDLRLIRRPHRPWQAEIELSGCSCNARRSFTRAGAERNAIRLHEKRAATPVTDGTPVSGVRGVCWSALTDEQRAACV